MAITYKDIGLLTQKATLVGTEKIPVSDTNFITPNQIVSGIPSFYSGSSSPSSSLGEDGDVYLQIGGTPIIGDPLYRDVVIFPVSGSPGVGLVRYGYTESLADYMMSPLYDLGNIGDGFSLSFSVNEVITSSGSSYPGLAYYDENKRPYTFHLANSNPRSVTGTVSSTQKYVRLVFKFQNILSSYIKDNNLDKYLFQGSEVNLAEVLPKERILESDSWVGYGPNSRGDWIGWNLAATNTASTAFRTDINYPIFSNVGQNASPFSYSVSKIVELPSGFSALSLEFSVGEVDSNMALRLLNPSTATANYYSANANPRTVSINTATYTHVQLYFKTANYASCYIKDATNNVMLWQGSNSIA